VKLEHSDSFWHVLDLTLRLQDGLLLQTFTQSLLIAIFICHFLVRTRYIAKEQFSMGVALRIKRTCSTDVFLQNTCVEYKGYLKYQNYPVDLVDIQFDKALSIPRSELLSKKVRPEKKVFPLVLDYNPILPDIQKIIRKHIRLLHSSPQIKRNFSIQICFSCLS